MPFLEIKDFDSVIRDYQLNAITDNNDEIVLEAIDAAIEEVSSILVPNDKKLWDDGRPKYDVDAIFSATGDNRNALIVRYTLRVGIWHLLDLCDTGIIYEEAKDRYDRAIESLEKLAAGDRNSRTLPRVTEEPPEDELPFAMGSRRKFNHE